MADRYHYAESGTKLFKPTREIAKALELNAMENNILTILLSHNSSGICGIYLGGGITTLYRQMQHPMFADRMSLDIRGKDYGNTCKKIKSAIESLETKGMISTKKNGKKYELILLEM